MKRAIFVISDLHLGGAEGFQMCPSAGRERLARFVQWVCGQKQEGTELQLVLNGDIMDFLAEEDDAGGFSSFVVDERQALRKLTRIADMCEPILTALRHFVAAGNRLTLLIGNHDLELSLPAIRRHFLGLLGDGRIEYLYDNEAYTIGPVLIEHGNRYDGWNMVSHGELRQIRSQLSRSETPSPFAAQPGSELVAQVMNPIKKKYAFVDLLKPETGGVVPILAVLDPALWRGVGTAVRQGITAWYRGSFTEEGRPERADYVAGASSKAGPETRGQALPENLRTGLDAADAAASGALSSGGGYVSGVRDIATSALLKAFRAWRSKADIVFSVEHEEDEYLKPARAHAKNYRVVVFGHTHLAKRINLDGGTVYLNTGTWADVMRIPRAVYDGDEIAGEDALRRFLDDVENNRVTAYRRQVATFARVDLDADERLLKADVFFFDDDGGATPISTEGMQERLA